MNIKELIKGIIIGVAKIIPGLSGAVLMISFNLYDKAIDAITNFFNNPKKNLTFLINLSLGIIIGIVLFSKIISYFLNTYYLYTTILFVGLIIGGIPVLKQKIPMMPKYYLLIISAFLSMSLITLLSPNNNYVLQNNYLDIIIFFVSGLLEAVGTVLPGISSTALLMLIGVYNNYIEILGNAFNITKLVETLYFVIPFSIGMLIGIIVISLIVNYLFKHYQEITFAVILGISLSTCLSLLIKLIPLIINFKILIISLILLILGYTITSKL